MIRRHDCLGNEPEFTYKVKIVQPCVLQALINEPLHTFGVLKARTVQTRRRASEETDLRKFRGNEEFFTAGNPRSLFNKFLCSVLFPYCVDVSVTRLQGGEDPRSRFSLFNRISTNEHSKTLQELGLPTMGTLAPVFNLLAI